MEILRIIILISLSTLNFYSYSRLYKRLDDVIDGELLWKIPTPIFMMITLFAGVAFAIAAYLKLFEYTKWTEPFTWLFFN